MNKDVDTEKSKMAGRKGKENGATPLLLFF